MIAEICTLGGIMFNVTRNGYFNPINCSFYQKARVDYYGGIYDLVSYQTKVAEYNPMTKTLKTYGWFSMTTARHIAEFASQAGFPEVKGKKMLDVGPKVWKSKDYENPNDLFNL